MDIHIKVSKAEDGGYIAYNEYLDVHGDGESVTEALRDVFNVTSDTFEMIKDEIDLDKYIILNKRRIT